MSTISKENFIKSVYTICNDSSSLAKTTEIANKLKISNAAVSDMARKLASSGFVSYERYKGIRLTNKGEKVALDILRKHRLWELFLTNVLNIPIEDVHDEAELLEHQTSEKLIDIINDYLEKPSFDPHGHPIPTKGGDVPELDGILLSNAEIGKKYLIKGIPDDNLEVMKYLSFNKILLGNYLMLENKIEFDNTYVIKIENQNVNLSQKICDKIFVLPN